MGTLKAVDNCLWSIHRACGLRDIRRYSYLRDKVSLIHDLSYGKECRGTYRSREKTIAAELCTEEHKKESHRQLGYAARRTGRAAYFR